MGAEPEGERGEEMRLWTQTIFMYVFNMFGNEMKVRGKTVA